MCHKSTGRNEQEDNYWSRVRGVKSLEFYNNDVVVNYMILPVKNSTGRKKEDTVKEFTAKSRKRLAFVASNTSIEFRYMTTLTYPAEFESNGKIVKGHLNTFLTWLRRKNSGVEYLWFLEFQRRGAPHFHVLTDCRLRKNEVSLEWFLIVGSDDDKHLMAGTRTEQLRSKRGGANYAIKYAKKMVQKTVPEGYSNVGRFWGHSKGVKPVVVIEHELERCTNEMLKDAMSWWEYKESLDKFPMGTLFNASGDYHKIMNGVTKKVGANNEK